MLQMSPAAAAQVRAAAAQSQADGLALRVAARRLGDGTVDWGLGFDDVREGDECLELEGVAVVVGRSSQPLVGGIRLDFVEIEPGDWRFVFVAPEAGPAARGGCSSGGCGTTSCGSGRGGCA